MSAVAPSEDPYRSRPVPVPADGDPSSNRGYVWIAIGEFFLAGLLLLLSAAMVCLTISYVLWAVREGNTPLFGMFMAASIRAGVAVAFAVLGLLLLMAARATRSATIENEPLAIKRMQLLHWILLFGMLALFTLGFLAIVMFFIALGFSSM